jgi:Golgi nucleoside diphosphatase
MGAFSFLFLALALAMALLTHATEIDEGYAILIDAGSTGSRAFVYDLKETTEENGGETVRTVLTSKGKKVMNGLSTYADKNPKEVLDYLAPIFLNASAQIPEEYHKSTQVYIKGTAGMRLLPVEKQEKLWKMLVKHLNKDKRNPFTIRRQNLGTIDGDSEAYYAALSSNYIAKSIDGNLRRVPGMDMVGALDMGGSSTQVIVNKNTPEGEKVKEEHFWSYSWINYGVEKIREKVDEHVVMTARRERGATSSSSGSSEGNGDDYFNPCTPSGYVAQDDHGNTLTGTGNATMCMQAIVNVLWKDRCTSAAGNIDSGAGADGSTPCYLADVEHPPLKGKFYAMSVYFYALDAVQQLGRVQLEQWPNPSLFELKQAVWAFCDSDWEHAQSWLNRAHRYTQDRNVPHRCVESMYLVTLLEHGFGYHEHSRDITFALDIEGREVEWTLGFVLANVGVRGVDKGVHRWVMPSGSPTAAVRAVGRGLGLANLNLLVVALRARGAGLVGLLKGVIARILAFMPWPRQQQ